MSEFAPEAIDTSTPENAVSTFDSTESTDEHPSLGVPVRRRRTEKVDEVIAAAKDLALTGILEITNSESVGPVHHVRGEEERLSTHLFECALPGYRGWFWFATLARAPRSKHVTVCEVGLLPGDDALLAPEWVPWSDRVRPEDTESDDDYDTTDIVDAEDVDEDAPVNQLETKSSEQEARESEAE
ncbi:DUF3027 domain-containing protein [Rothia terrae]|uniref:DUF3027 domain-containing protein n=1 Tax=Rothia terrae TaxID=396015 RepID=UPI001445DF45|nr:DUF3027 domain-containing protein [Rothia terrae]MDT0189508.1 DUF3027 domain-containing protein [Rothia terrae]NKZ34148.1 DUF3027 domain-containing protein [Rothia terrae]